MISGQPLLFDATLAGRARALTDRMAARLLEIADLPPSEWSPYGGGPGLSGAGGLALGFAALAQTRGDERYRVAMHAQLKRASSELASGNISAFGGLSGVRAAAAYAQAIIPAYGRLIEQCDAHIDKLGAEHPVTNTFESYDVIAGLSGMRLCRSIRGISPTDWMIDNLLIFLGDDARWLCLNAFSPEMGWNNVLGVAHGIAGVIAAIALSTDPASVPDEVRAAARRLADTWDDSGCGWRYSLQTTGAYPQRLGWCYGSVAIGAVLAATARWCGDDELLDQTRERLERLSEMTDQPFADEAICHGTMGGAISLASAASVTGSGVLAAFAMRLVERAIEHLEAADGKCEALYLEGRRYEAFSYLDGSAGIVLSLCTLFDGADADWMRLHGLAPIR